MRNEHAMANYSSSTLSKEKSKRELSEGDTPNGKKRRGNYASYTPQQRIEIGAFSIGKYPYLQTGYGPWIHD